MGTSKPPSFSVNSNKSELRQNAHFTSQAKKQAAIETEINNVYNYNFCFYRIEIKKKKSNKGDWNVDVRCL